MPMLRDRGLLETDFGSEMLAAGAVGEFGPVVAVTLFLGTSSPTVEGLVLIAFVLAALALAHLAARPKPPRVVEALTRNLETSSQLPVRIVMLLVTVMVLMASFLGIDMLLGAFAAGLIGRIIFPPDESTRLMAKVESIGYGFLIPVFFIVSGMNFDLDALTSDPTTLARVPLFLGLFLVLRGVPALLLYRGVLAGRQRSALAVLQSTALPLLVVITEIGLATDNMKPANAAAIVGAGMLSVLVFPLVGFSLLGERDATHDERANA